MKHSCLLRLAFQLSSLLRLPFLTCPILDLLAFHRTVISVMPSLYFHPFASTCIFSNGMLHCVHYLELSRPWLRAVVCIGAPDRLYPSLKIGHPTGRSMFTFIDSGTFPLCPNAASHISYCFKYIIASCIRHLLLPVERLVFVFVHHADLKSLGN